MIKAVIPIFRMDGPRRRNLEFVHKRLVSSGIKVVFAIQDKIVEDYYLSFKDAEIMNFHKDGLDSFNKSFIFNSVMASDLECDFIMLIDADIYMNFSHVSESILPGDEIVKPFSECVYLTEKITQEFIHEKRATVTPDLKRVSALGGGAVIIRRDISKETRLDERFTGWGWEDLDFGDALRFKYKVRTLDQIAVHLYHEPCQPNMDNCSYYNSKEKTKFKVVHVFSADASCVESVKSYVDFRNNGILVMNCCDIDYVNNDSVKFQHVGKSHDGYSMNEMFSAAMPYLEDDGWILYTDANFKINEYVYPDLMNYGDGFDFVEYQGCEISKGAFARTNICPNAFAIKKLLWSSKKVPPVFAGRRYWNSIVSESFRDSKKKSIRNQISGRLREDSSDCNLDSLRSTLRCVEGPKYDVTLITPTGGREKALSLCRKYVESGSHGLSVQWIVVNDYDDEAYDFATDMVFVRGNNPLGQSILAAVPHIRSDFVLFMEDDDWYSSDYIPHYMDMLKKADLVGQAHAKFYNVGNGTYEYRSNSNEASLCQTGIRADVLLENLNAFDLEYNPNFDFVIWNSSTCTKLLEPVSDLCVGIKGMAGRPGLGTGHNRLPHKDRNMTVLREWVGGDCESYADNYQPLSVIADEYERFTESDSVMYFSPFAPDFDMSSGGNRLLKMLEILRLDLGLNVHFFCNGSLSERHLEVMHKMGINYYLPEKGNYHLNRLMEMKRSGMKFSCAIFSWYDIGDQYIKHVKEFFPGIKIVSDSVDLHWKRELRGLDEGLLQTSSSEVCGKKQKEISVYMNSDVVFAVTPEDREEMLSEMPDVNVKLLSNIHEKTDNVPEGPDVLFVGNFNHLPNVSAALECIAIFSDFCESRVYASLKEKPSLFIVGPNPPPEIFEAASTLGGKCLVTGQVPDLSSFYRRCKTLLAPLRWGSGIKGKICDSACNGLVVITSDIGNEGIHLEDGRSCFLAESRSDFVDKLEKAYAMDVRFVAEEGRRKVSSLVSKEAALCVLRHTVAAKPVLVVIVTYNKSESLKRCLLSILSMTKYPDYRILVVDNASPDDTEEMMRGMVDSHLEIEYVRNEENEFFIPPNNRAMLDPKNSERDVVLINDDLEVTNECWLSQMYSAAYSEKDVCAVGGKILRPDRTISEAGSELYSDGTGRNLGRGAASDNPEFNYRRSVGYCSGCFLYMRRDAIDRIGVLDEDLNPMYYDDSEWQYRAHLKGLKTLYEPRSECVHHEDENKPMKTYQEVNRVKFVSKYGPLNIERYNGRGLSPTSSIKQDWRSVALKAVSAVFDGDGKLDKTKTTHVKFAKKMLYKSLDMNPDEAWPFIKLGDLVEDPKERCRLYKKSIDIEPTVTAKALLYDLLFKGEK